MVNVRIPKSAEMVGWASCSFPDGTANRDTLHLKMWKGQASKGYRSNYERVPHYWMEMIAYNKDGSIDVHHAWMYSGRRLQRAISDWRVNVDDMYDGGVNVVVHVDMS